MYQLPIQDEIQFTLKVQQTIVHETVRINVVANAKVDPDTDEDGFRTSVKQALSRFIEAEWKIQSVQRAKGQSRYETVTVMATARVPERENHHLQDRASEVSTHGLELVSPSADYSLTFDEVQRVNEELRLALVQKAAEECQKHNDLLKPLNSYRLGHIAFHPTGNHAIRNATSNAHGYAASAAMQGVYAMSAGPPSPEEAEEDGAVDLSVSTRFTMEASIVLRSVVS